jgi:hypothetical protein
MKSRISLFLFFALISSFIWMACDKVDEPLKIVSDREFPVGLDDTLFFIDSTVIAHKQVLLEDFTGHKCVNCPTASKLLKELRHEYFPRLIAYTIHAGAFAAVEAPPFHTDLSSNIAKTLHDKFQPFGYPVGLIDRTEHSGMRQIFPDSWQNVVNNRLLQHNKINLIIRNTYFPKYNAVLIDIKIDFLEDIDDLLNLVVFIVEDSIVSPQMNNNPEIGENIILDYVHFNVLRDNVTPDFGERLNLNDLIAAGCKMEKQFVYILKDEWNTAHCKVIAYIGKSDETYGLVDIIQAGELGIKTEE